MSAVRELPKEGEIFDGKYLIGPVLGIGGMAAVLAATHSAFGELVAVKVLLPEFCEDVAVVERFVQEGRTASKIRSEHVVRMLDASEFEGRAYLVMEHLSGKDLDAVLRADGPLPLSTAVDFLLQACEAIGEAHKLGIVHRDLKPANLFLTHRPDGTACVKILDFGISKMPCSIASAQSDPRLTLPATVMGSPHYMSPEQMTSAANADQRSDIWSLGAMLYEFLTGELAFGGATTASVCARVLRGTVVPLTQQRPEIPADVGLIVGRCLEKDRARRYSNVAELARALAPFGSAGARASAASITRIFEGEAGDGPLASMVAGPKPTAAEILAGATPRRRRLSGYFVGAALSAVALVVGGSLGQHALRGTWWPGAGAPPSSSFEEPLVRGALALGPPPPATRIAPPTSAPSVEQLRSRFVTPHHAEAGHP